jgi:hypothetical protein
MMPKSIGLLFLTAAAMLAQYKMEPAGPPPAEVAPGMVEKLQKEGVRVTGSKGVFCEIWLVSQAPSGPKNADEAVDLPTIPQGAFAGVIRFPAKGEDRRGQGIKPGVYALRYSLYPVNGDHQGVAPQRDFLLMTPAAEDKDPAAAPGFDDLVKMSRKASGTPHPAVLSISQSRNSKQPDLTHEESTWTLHLKMGDVAIAIIVIGRAEG